MWDALCVVELPPFTPPLPAPTDPHGWRGGVRVGPTWAIACGCVYTSGLHHLLRAAQLPREELLHMGASRHLLRSSAPLLTPIDEAAALLGRIVWDAQYGHRGTVWSDKAHYVARANVLGYRVLDMWFA